MHWMNIDFLCTATFQPVISKHFHLLIVVNEKSMANLIYLPNFQTCLNTREHRLSFCMTKLYWIGNPHFCGWNQRYLLLRAFFNVCKIFYLDFYVIYVLATNHRWNCDEKSHFIKRLRDFIAQMFRSVQTKGEK